MLGISLMFLLSVMSLIPPVVALPDQWAPPHPGQVLGLPLSPPCLLHLPPHLPPLPHQGCPLSHLVHPREDESHGGSQAGHTEMDSQLPHHLPLLLDPTPALQTHGPAQPVHPVGCQGVQEGESAIIDTTGTEFSEPSFYVSVIYLSIHLKTIFFMVSVPLFILTE